MAGAEIGALIAKILVPVVGLGLIAWFVVWLTHKVEKGAVSESERGALQKMAEASDRAENVAAAPIPTGPDEILSRREQRRRRREELAKRSPIAPDRK